MAGKVEIEWLEPERWAGRRQMYPARQVHGRMEVGAEVQVSYARKMWKAKIINCSESQGMSGQPPSTEAAKREQAKAEARNAPKGNLTKDIEHDNAIIEQVERQQEALDDSFHLSEDEDDDVLLGGEEVEGDGGEGVGAETASTSTGSRWNIAKPALWKRNVRKAKRLQGEEYVGQRGKVTPEKKMKLFDGVCCKKKKCSQHFPEAERNDLFKMFYSLDSYKRQRDYVLAQTEALEVERTRPRLDTPKTIRKQTFVYTLPKKQEDESVKQVLVCLKFFMATLGLSEGSLRYALEHRSTTGQFEVDSDDKRKSPANKLKPDVIQAVKDHIESFPVMESHYCRSGSQRKYFAADLTIQKLYNLYTEKCQTNGQQAVSFSSYKGIFGKQYNIGFYHPRKDQCQTCTRYKLASTEKKAEIQEAQDEHLARKERAQNQKKEDASEAKMRNNLCVASFDLQSVLQIPSSEVSPMYYKRKICVYNLTIYECKPPNVAHCYVWSEIDGKRGSSEIGSCLLHFISQLPDNVEELILYSDSCGGQNRNQYVAAAMLWAVEKMAIKSIKLCFLEPGHTQMECDSMHASIEHEKKHKHVYGLNEWLNIMLSARRNRPYNVHRLTFRDFYDLKSLARQLVKNRNKNEDGQLVSWLEVRLLKFTKGKKMEIEYKRDYSGGWKVIPVQGLRSVGRPEAFPEQANMPKVYKHQLEISQQKKKDLVDLCKNGVIPEEYHGWLELKKMKLLFNLVSSNFQVQAT